MGVKDVSVSTATRSQGRENVDSCTPSFRGGQLREDAKKKK